MSDLTDRLRIKSIWLSQHANIKIEAADRIDELEAENIKLRGVLNEMRCRRGKCAVIHGLR
jgi:hypothetical protein